MSREPKIIKLDELLDEQNKNDYELKLAQYNEDNFIYLPLTFNHRKLNSIGRDIDTLLSKNNPQILIKSEQLRQGSSSRKIHLIFKYETENSLGKVINNKEFTLAHEENTLALDVNLKHNLLVDSNSKHYDDILKLKNNNKNKLIENINEIVSLYAKPIIDRTIKEKYRYEKHNF